MYIYTCIDAVEMKTSYNVECTLEEIAKNGQKMLEV